VTTSSVQIQVPWHVGKGIFLDMPPEFLKLLPNQQGEFAIVLIDEAGRRMATLYDAGLHHLELRGLMQWIARHEPNAGDHILFRQKTPLSVEFEIIFESSRPSQQQATGGLFLGNLKDSLGHYQTDKPFRLPVEDLVTHLFICGVTGSGKTVLLKAVLEEAIANKIPSLIIDLKGDLSSIALAFSELSPEQFAPWVRARQGQTQEEAVNAVVDRHRAGLAGFDLDEDDMRRLHDQASFAVFSPRHGYGIPLAISSLLEAPDNIAELIATEPNYVLETIDAFVTSFVKSLFGGRRLSRLNKYKTYLSEIVRYAWEHHDRLDGQAGLGRVQNLILAPPFTQIGGMPLDRFINEKERNELGSRIAMMLSGGEQLWFQGVPLDIDRLLSRPDATRTPVTIVNVHDLPNFDDQTLVVSHISNALFLWARKQGDAGDRARLLFVLDEIAGGGGREAFFPSPPYESPSKPGLNRLLRQGRAYGVSCLFATQNPADVDYKGLSNCGTWLVGKLQTDRDRKKIMQGMSAAEIYIDRVEDQLRGLDFGVFLAKLRNGQVRVFQERWLLTHHTLLNDSQLGQINQPEIMSWFKQ